MKNIIKSVLKEYFNHGEVKFIPILNFIKGRVNLIEGDVYGDEEIDFSKEDREKVNSYFRYLYKKISSIGTFHGEFQDKFTQKKYKIYFNIVPMYHFAERRYREEDPKYAKDERVINPKDDEGINILINNKDRLAQEIVLKRIKNRDLVKIVAKDGSHFKMLVDFQENDEIKKGVGSINLILVNQIKGPNLDFYKFKKELKLFPPRE